MLRMLCAPSAVVRVRLLATLVGTHASSKRKNYMFLTLTILTEPGSRVSRLVACKCYLSSEPKPVGHPFCSLDSLQKYHKLLTANARHQAGPLATYSPRPEPPFQPLLLRVTWTCQAGHSKGTICTLTLTFRISVIIMYAAATLNLQQTQRQGAPACPSPACA
jgi:hypothetical protein